MKRAISDNEQYTSFEEHEFNSFFAHPEIGVFIASPDGAFLKVNKRFCEMVDYTEEELLGLSLNELSFSDNTDNIPADDGTSSLQSHKSGTFEKRIIKKDKSLVWLQFIISLIPGTSENAYQYMAIVQDITSRKSSEKELRDTKEVLERIFDTTNTMIAYLDVNFNFIRVNKQYAIAGNHPPEFFIGKNHFDLYPCEENKAIFRHAVETGQSVSFTAKPFEYMEYPELGVTYWDWDLIPVKDSKDTVTGLIFSLVDVTKRKRAENELKRTNELLEEKVRERTSELQNEIAERKRIEEVLRQSEQRYREVFENTSDGIFIIDVTGDSLFKFADINPSKERMIGKKNTDTFGKYLHQVFPFEYAEITNSNCRRCIESRDILCYEEQLSIASGNVYICTTLIPIKNDEGSIYRILGVCRDITEYRLMSDSLRNAKEAAEHASNAKSEYIANMSHELRTPLNVIMSAIQLFDLYIKTDPSSKTDKFSKHLKSMRQNCLRLLRLVNNLIDTTKVDANFYNLNLGNFDIINVIKTLTLSVSDYVKNKRIKLTFDSNIEKKIIAFDIDIAERIMLNLLSNAIKFTEPGGTIQVSVIDRLENIIISIKDDGIGIPKDKQQAIFERYKQADRLLTRKHKGSGIGLSLTKSFIEMLGGKVSLISEYGLGSEFIVELPCTLVASADFSQKDKYNSGGSKIIEKIIVELSDIYNIDNE